MRKSTLEQQIAEMSDLDELDKMAYRYANGGNCTVALMAWMRAEELGCTKYRKNITAQLFYNDVQGAERRKAEAMVAQWLKDGDKDAIEAIELMKAIHGWKEPESTEPEQTDEAQTDEASD